jgi:hypothetical protein
MARPARAARAPGAGGLRELSDPEAAAPFAASVEARPANPRQGFSPDPIGSRHPPPGRAGDFNFVAVGAVDLALLFSTLGIWRGPRLEAAGDAAARTARSIGAAPYPGTT